MRMLVIRFAAVLTVVLALSGLVVSQSNQLVSAQEPNKPEPNAPARRMPPTTGTNLFTPPPEKLFSPSVSALFYEMAYEIAHRENIPDSQAEQAITLLNAAMELDASAGFITADMLQIASRPGPERHLQMLYDTLIKYTDKNADLLVAANTARYLLDQLDSRQQRETLLRRLIQDIGESNFPSVPSSPLCLGFCTPRRPTTPTQSELWLRPIAGTDITSLPSRNSLSWRRTKSAPILNLEYLRLKLRKNPLDLGAALALAQYAQRTQLYELAVGSYQYCADLFQFLYPDQDVPAAIYIDWMTSCYNAPRGQPKCLQLAEQFRGSTGLAEVKQGRFDLQMEVLAAKAAAKTGDTETAGRILETAEQKAIQSAGRSTDYYATLAWFYCFVRKNSEQAIDWANKAYAAEPNSPIAAGLLACALVDNNQLDAVKPLLENFPQTQFADFAKAKLQLATGQKQSAVESLRATIDKDPGSIAAEQALMLLAEQKTEYIPIYDTNVILTTVKQTVGEQIIPQFVRPDRMLSFQLNVRGNRFAYGNDFTAQFPSQTTGMSRWL